MWDDFVWLTEMYNERHESEYYGEIKEKEKKFYNLKIKYMKKVLRVLLLLVVIGGVFWFRNSHKETPKIDYTIIETWIVSTWMVDTWIVSPTTGSVFVTFEAQPTQLPWNYQDNGTFLRARAEKNIKTLAIPAGIKDVKIGFVFARTPQYEKIPGNLQLSLNGKNFCNGRLVSKWATILGDENILRYNFNDIHTQDKPNGVDLTSTIGKELGIKVWIGESRNYLKSIVVNYSL